MLLYSWGVFAKKAQKAFRIDKQMTKKKEAT